MLFNSCNSFAYATYFGMKSAGKGGDFNGKTVKDIIHDELKLIDLEEILPPNAKIFVEWHCKCSHCLCV